MPSGKATSAVLGDLELKALLDAVRGLADLYKVAKLLSAKLKTEIDDLDLETACERANDVAKLHDRVVKSIPSLVRELRQSMAAIDRAGDELSAEETAAALMEAARGLPREIRWRLASELSGQDRRVS